MAIKKLIGSVINQPYLFSVISKINCFISLLDLSLGVTRLLLIYEALFRQERQEEP